MKQTVLVVGGSGFIGGRVVKALTATDWAVPIAASRRAASGPGTNGHEVLQLDAIDGRQVRAALREVSAVVNCVAGRAETIVQSARSLFSAASELAHGPRIVNLSSMAVYGAAVGEVNEATAVGRELSAYGAAKAQAEDMAAAYPAVVTLRPGIVYGPCSSQWSGRIGGWLVARRLGDLGAAGDGYCNLVYIDDVVEAILRSVRMPGLERRVFNLASPAPPTWNDYFIAYAKALGAVPVARIGQRRLQIEAKLLAPPLKIAELIAARMAPSIARALPEPIPPSLVRSFAQEIRLSTTAAEQSLQLSWTPLVEGLERAAQWYRTDQGNRNRAS
jgi:2-alkyl-3-oxoalkanoate reductase